MRHVQLAVLPADGVGPEVIGASRKVLETLAQMDGGIKFEFREFDWGSERYLKTGRLMPEDGTRQLERGGFDALLVGPVGDMRIPDHVTLWGLLLPIRQEFDQYVNLRPMRLLDGVESPLR